MKNIRAYEFCIQTFKINTSRLLRCLKSLIRSFNLGEAESSTKNVSQVILYCILLLSPYASFILGNLSRPSAYILSFHVRG